MTSPHCVVAGTRRIWSAQDKRAILTEAEETTTSVSAVARRHGLHASLLFRWRRDARDEEQSRRPPPPSFIPLGLPMPMSTTPPPSRAGSIEIETAAGHRIRAEPGADPAVLRSVIEALVGR